MKTRAKLMRFGTTLLLASSLAGCAIPSKETPVSNLKPWKPIRFDCADTKETRAQVIEHNNVYLTLKTGKKIVYGDTCPETKPQPKTS